MQISRSSYIWSLYHSQPKKLYSFQAQTIEDMLGPSLSSSNKDHRWYLRQLWGSWGPYVDVLDECRVVMCGVNMETFLLYEYPQSTHCRRGLYLLWLCLYLLFLLSNSCSDRWCPFDGSRSWVGLFSSKSATKHGIKYNEDNCCFK